MAKGEVEVYESGWRGMTASGAVCHEELVAGEIVRRLACEHIFHDPSLPFVFFYLPSEFSQLIVVVIGLLSGFPR